MLHASSRKVWQLALRGLAALLLVVVTAALPTQIAGAFADLCGDDCGDCGEDRGASNEDDHDCDCPLGCAACCAKTAPRAAVSSLELLVRGAGGFWESGSVAAFGLGPDGIPFEVLHVPRRVT